MRFADPEEALGGLLQALREERPRQEPAKEKSGYGSPSEPRCASRPKKIVKTTMVNERLEDRPRAPRTVCL